MDHVNNIPTGLLVPAQVPLDAKRVVLNNAILQDLGTGNHLAFTYEDGLVVFSVATRQSWEWRKVNPVEYDTALLPTPFTYPDNHIVAGIDYSLKTYNFFLKVQALPLVNLGAGKKVYKGINVVNQKHEFYTLETDGKITLSYPQVSGIETGVLLFTFPGFENYSTNGTPIFKGYEPVGNKFQFYTIDSEDIKIEFNPTTGIINLSLPESSSVPSIYINQDYVPSYDDWFKANRLANGGTPVAGYQYKGEGTLAKPFTNSVTYTLGTPTPAPVSTVANSSIQNGIDYYVGSGTRLVPQRYGQKIQILSSQNSYTYSGDFSYTGLNLEIYGYVISTTTGKLIDMDNPLYFINPTTPTFSLNTRIYLEETAVLEIRGLGFWNSGYNIVPTNYTHNKGLYLLGKGRIVSTQDDINRYIINSGITYPTYNNAGFLTFEVTCKIFSVGGPTGGGQGLIQNGGLSKVEFRDGAYLGSGTLTTPTTAALEVIKITGGWIRVFDSIIDLQGTNGGALDRERGITLEKSGTTDAIGGPQIYMVSSSLRGHAKRWFDRKGNCGGVIMSNCSTTYFSGGDLFTSTGNATVWGSNYTEGFVSLKNSTFDNINIDTDKIDLTISGSQSVSNLIGQNVVQSLRIFGCKQDAASPPYNLPPGALFIKRTYINDASLLSQFKVGDSFRIATQSTPATNFIPMHIGYTPITNIVGDHIAYNGNSLSVPAFTSATGVMLHYDEICIMT